MSKGIMLEDWEYFKGDFINRETGEVIEFGESFVKVIDEEIADGDFARVYLDTIENLPYLTKGEQRLLWHFLKKMNYVKTDSYVINFGEDTKKETAEKLGYSMPSIYKALYGLRDKGVIIFLARNKIQINPKYFSKGNALDIVAVKYSLCRINGKYFKITELATKKKHYDKLPEKYVRYTKKKRKENFYDSNI